MKKKLLLLTCCTLLLSGCLRDKDKFTADKKADILRVETPANSLEADGASVLPISAFITPEATNKNVSFTTNLGKFLDGSKIMMITASNTGNSLVAGTFLQAPFDTSSYGLIRVTAGGVETVVNITFKTALPDALHIEADSGAITSGYNTRLSISVYLNRNTGVPSRRQMVDIYAKKLLGDTTIGMFSAMSPNGSDSTGKITALYQLKDVDYGGYIRIYAKLRGSNLYSDTLKIFIKK
jgi:hypothetical protein